jgi:magnesium-transporting ATPase (P-type)
MQILYYAQIVLEYYRNNKSARILYDILFLLVLFILCYLTAIIFYANPNLFNMLGNLPVDWGSLLLLGMPFIIFVPLCFVLFLKPSQYCCFTKYANPKDDKNGNKNIFIVWCILTIVLSNLLTLVTFRFITIGPAVVIVPFLSNLGATGFSFLFVTVMSCYRKNIEDGIDLDQQSVVPTESCAR